MFDDWFEYLMGALLISLVAVLVYGVADYLYADKFSLVKDDWKCTQEKTRLIPQVVGKSTILMPMPHCVQYTQVNQ